MAQSRTIQISEPVFEEIFVDDSLIKYTGNIPLKIFQTWKTKNPEYSLRLFQESWKRCNPDFEYVIFDDNDCDNYVKNKATEYIEVWEKIKLLGSKAICADFIRYLYIYNEGGIYSDIDTICLKSFIELYKKYPNKKIILGLESDLKDENEAKSLNIAHPKSLALHTFISAAKHPIFKYILDQIAEKINTIDTNFNIIERGNDSMMSVLNLTGPGRLNSVIYNYGQIYKDDIVIEGIHTFSNGLWIPHSGCNSTRNNPNSFSCHLYFSSWINKQIIEFNRNPISPGNFHCSSCKKLIGNIQEHVQDKYYGPKGIHPIQSLVNYSEKMDELDIYMLVKDNELYLKKYFPPIKKEMDHHFKTTWFVYENGSNDDSKNLLRYFFNENYEGQNFQNKYNFLDKFHNFKCNYCIECKQNTINWSDKVSLNDGEISNEHFNKENVRYIDFKLKNEKIYQLIGYRCEKLAIARENLLKLSTIEHNLYLPYPKWCLLIDSDVVFDYENTIKPLLEASQKYPDGVMFCANSHCVAKPYGNRKYKIDSTGNKYIHNYYYDTFALNYGNYLWDANIVDTMDSLFNNSDVCKVTSAFNGCVLIKKEVLNMSSWNTICQEAKKYKAYKNYGMLEHYHFCEDVRRFGEIYVVKNAIAHWMMDNGYNSSTNTPTCVPRAEEKVKNAIISNKLLKNYINYNTL